MEKAAILATSALLFLSNSVIADSVKEQATNTAAETVTSSTIMEQITNEITTSALTTNGAAYMVLAGGVLASLYLVKNVNKKRLSNEESPAPSWGNKKNKKIKFFRKKGKFTSSWRIKYIFWFTDRYR